MESDTWVSQLFPLFCILVAAGMIWWLRKKERGDAYNFKIDKPLKPVKEEKKVKKIRTVTDVMGESDSGGHKTGDKAHDDLVDFYSLPGTTERVEKRKKKNEKERRG